MRVLVKIKSRMANSVDPDETARYGPSDQDLHRLQDIHFSPLNLRVKLLHKVI